MNIVVVLQIVSDCFIMRLFYKVVGFQCGWFKFWLLYNVLGLILVGSQCGWFFWFICLTISESSASGCGKFGVNIVECNNYGV